MCWEMVLARYFSTTVSPLVMKKSLSGPDTEEKSFQTPGPVQILHLWRDLLKTILTIVKDVVWYFATHLNYVTVPNNLILIITILLYLSSRCIRNHLVKVSARLISWVVTLRKRLTQEIRHEASPKWYVKKTKQELRRTWKMLLNTFPVIEYILFAVKNLMIFLILD